MSVTKKVARRANIHTQQIITNALPEGLTLFTFLVHDDKSLAGVYSGLAMEDEGRRCRFAKKKKKKTCAPSRRLERHAYAAYHSLLVR
jgi:peptide subunit release factor 1 (eRF1)